MKIAGIICEYNPFHNGHKYQIEKTREQGATHICALMSGQFVQRGELAIFDKWTRAKAALLNGADLVLEMPTAYSLSASNRFALAGVQILKKIGCEILSFGSELGNIEELKSAAKLCQDIAKSNEFSVLLSKGYSYPKALQLAAHELTDIAKILTSPNNVLAIEYINAIEELSAKMVPFTINRIGCTHDGNILEEENLEENLKENLEESSFQSASYIRAHLTSLSNSNSQTALVEMQKYLPKSAVECYKSAYEEKCAPLLESRLETAILYKLRSMKKEDFALLQDVNEGLENRLFKVAKSADTLDNFYKAVKTKRYTMARIRRITMSAFLQIPKQTRLPSYIHVLGANKKGLEILSACKKKCQKGENEIIPKFADLYNSVEDSEIFQMLKCDCYATDISALAYEKIMPCGMDFTHKLIILP